MYLVVKEYVGGLEIPVEDFALVQDFKAEEQLIGDGAREVGGQGVGDHGDEGQQVVLAVLEHDRDAGGLELVVEQSDYLNKNWDIGMVVFFQDLDFALYNGALLLVPRGHEQFFQRHELV